MPLLFNCTVHPHRWQIWSTTDMSCLFVILVSTQIFTWVWFIFVLQSKTHHSHNALRNIIACYNTLHSVLLFLIILRKIIKWPQWVNQNLISVFIPENRCEKKSCVNWFKQTSALILLWCSYPHAATRIKNGKKCSLMQPKQKRALYININSSSLNQHLTDFAGLFYTAIAVVHLPGHYFCMPDSIICIWILKSITYE